MVSQRKFRARLASFYLTAMRLQVKLDEMWTKDSRDRGQSPDAKVWGIYDAARPGNVIGWIEYVPYSKRYRVHRHDASSSKLAPWRHFNLGYFDAGASEKADLRKALDMFKRTY